MKIGLLQFDVLWEDPKNNFRTISDLLSLDETAYDLIVLPEMFDTGYVMNPRSLNNWNHKESIQKMHELSLRHNTAICGSIPTYRGDSYYNTFICVYHDQVVTTYDKMHLFSLAKEDVSYTSGHKISLFRINEFTLQPLICYDLRFPYISYNTHEYDVLIYVANWPIGRIEQWKSLLQARAIENQSYVIGVNRIGKDKNNLSYNGHSMAISYDGKILLDAEDNPGIHFVEIQKPDLNKYREKLPFLKDQKLK